MIKIALVGQPNSGKSTIFNSIAGYKVRTGNFPGVTVKYTETVVRIGNNKAKVIDLPGIYSFYTNEPAEIVTKEFILDQDIDVILNVVDSSVLSRSLELTVELTEFGIPMVIALNMTDEANRKGLEIDEKTLSEIFGVPVVKTVGNKGIGVKELFEMALKDRRIPKELKYDKRFWRNNDP